MKLTYPKKHLGDLLKEKCEQAQLDIMDVAKALGVKRTMAYRTFKREDLPIHKLKKLAQLLGEDLVKLHLSMESLQREAELEAQVNALTKRLRELEADVAGAGAGAGE